MTLFRQAALTSVYQRALSSTDLTTHISVLSQMRPEMVMIQHFCLNRVIILFNFIQPAFLAVGDFNIVVVDWSPYSTQNYVVARTKSKAVGEYVGLMINYLVDMGMDIDDLIVMGHSMGAHIAGVASRNANSTVPYVIGEQINRHTSTVYPTVVKTFLYFYHYLALKLRKYCLNRFTGRRLSEITFFPAPSKPDHRF